MNQSIDISSKISLAEGEKIVKKYSEWESKRDKPFLSLIIGIVIFLILLLTKYTFLILLGSLFLAMLIFNFLRQYLTAQISSGIILLSNRRLLLLSQHKGAASDQFTLDSIKLDSVIGMCHYEGLILKTGRFIPHVSGTLAEEIFFDLMELRYNQT